MNFPCCSNLLMIMILKKARATMPLIFLRLPVNLFRVENGKEHPASILTCTLVTFPLIARGLHQVESAMQNAAVARMFDDIADCLEIAGENVFRGLIVAPPSPY